MVAKCYHSADIILDQAGEGLVIGGGNAGLQPVTVGGGQQAGVNIEDQFGGVAPLPKDGKVALVAAQQVAGGAFGLLRGLRRAKKKSPAKARPFPTKIILPSVVFRTGNSLKGRWWRHRFSLSLSLLYARGRENSAFLIENWVTIW